MNVVESPAEWWKGDTPGKPVMETAKERGYDLHAPFVTQEEADRRMFHYKLGRIGRAAAIVCGVTMVIVSGLFLRRAYH